MSLITFIIPTIGRDTLARTIQSIVEQTDPDWNALIVADGVDGFSIPVRDGRVFCSNLPARVGTSNHGGHCRNMAMACAGGEWCGFVDDDDHLHPSYIEWLKEDGKNADVLVFHMQYADGSTLPRGDTLEFCGVGISFAVKTREAIRNGLRFNNGAYEDWEFLSSAMKAGMRIKVSARIAYFVRH